MFRDAKSATPVNTGPVMPPVLRLDKRAGSPGVRFDFPDGDEILNVGPCDSDSTSKFHVRDAPEKDLFAPEPLRAAVLLLDLTNAQVLLFVPMSAGSLHTAMVWEREMNSR